jgi:radical SAM superfamily enzyme YgiQ (UPF0313 family)
MATIKIIISFPPLPGKGFPMLRQARQFQWVSIPSHIYPLIAASAASLLQKEGFDIIFNDCLVEGWSFDKFLRFIRSEQPDMIAFETKTPVIKLHWKMIDQLKWQIPSLKIVLMGDHVTVFPEESLQQSKADYVITGGDYDIALLRLAKHLRDKTPLPRGIWYRDNTFVNNAGDFELIEDLDTLPFVNRDLTKWQLYGEKWKKRTPFAYTMAGRDCPYGKCSFCSWTSLFPKFRVRTPENILDEIGLLIQKYNVREIFDDTGTFPGGEWLNKFCEGMIKRGFNKKILFSCNSRFDYLTEENVKLMKKAGFRKLKLGFESANQRTLDKLDKGITISQIINGCKIASKADLEVHLTVMFGYPWESEREAMNTLGLAQELLNKGYAEMLQATVLVPYPGTLLFYEGIKNGWFRFDHKQYERYDMTEPVFITDGIQPERVMQICDSAYKIFFSPKFIFKKLLTLNRFDNLTYLFRGAIAMYGHLRDFYDKKVFR